MTVLRTTHQLEEANGGEWMSAAGTWRASRSTSKRLQPQEEINNGGNAEGNA